ncbi:MAG TPA: CSLREA domain-containing protein, partial [Pyrinomonadaceae bacterium]|nr:CSLREA domain-containing protein [Pyrinomonadaceae bacterium]
MKSRNLVFLSAMILAFALVCVLFVGQKGSAAGTTRYVANGGMDPANDCASTPGVFAGSFTVNSLGDTPDANTGDNLCADAAGDCTLRAAIEQANATAGADTVNFDLPGAGPHTIQLSSALPVISDGVDILNTSGESVTVRRNTGGDYRIFNINTGINSGKTVNIFGLTITNGKDNDGG